MTDKHDKKFCIHLDWYDNGYLYGYYCSLTGNRCSYLDTEGLGCVAFENEEVQNDVD
ncbi:MAG: hypothetical protein H0Z24_06945 [Thermosipho sp. (in: Bacteria)]|nr:hypothetical protein [Thermosipho sp. (in: thermotogales)]